jgi:hypothetical protein
MTTHDPNAPVIDATAERERLISRGIIRPGASLFLPRLDLDDRPTLRLDDRGRAAAARHCAMGAIPDWRLNPQRKSEP